MRYILHSDAQSSPLGITQLGFSRDDEGTRFGPGQRACYIIHYVTKGSGIFNGHSVRAGQGFLIYPDQLTEYHGVSPEPWEFLWIISTEQQMEDVFRRYHADAESGIFDYGDRSPAKETAEAIIKNHNTMRDPLELTELFLHLCNSHFKKQPPNRVQANSEIYLQFCMTYLENNIHKKINTADLTALLGVSQPYLYKIFAEKLGTSPKSYIISYKMARAKKLLRQTQMTVTQIANSLGYGDSLTFSKAFKVSEGCSPSEYREVIDR